MFGCEESLELGVGIFLQGIEFFALCIVKLEHVAQEKGKDIGWLRGCRKTAGPAPGPTTTAGAAHAWAMRGVEGLVHVVGEDVELAFFIEGNAVVTGADPIAIAIDETNIKCQEPEQAIDIEDFFKFGFQVFRWSLVQHPAQVDKSLPAFFFVG